MTRHQKRNFTRNKGSDPLHLARRDNALWALVALVSISLIALLLPNTVSAVGNGKIAFVRNGDLLTFDPANASTVAITSGPSIDSSPSWSPDGSELAFTSNRGGDQDIYVSQDGAVMPLKDTPESEQGASWSPDGSWVVTSRKLSSGSDLFAISRDGAEVRLTNSSPYSERSPAWSPVDSRVAFSADYESAGGVLGDREIFVLNGDGTIYRLTDNEVYDNEPAWSPDGSKVAFTSSRSGNFDIWTVAANGANLVQVTNTPEYERTPRWSPDGSRILFKSENVDGLGDRVDSVNPDGSDRQTLIPDAQSPSWQPFEAVLPDVPVDPPQAQAVEGPEVTVKVYSRGRVTRKRSGRYRVRRGRVVAKGTVLDRSGLGIKSVTVDVSGRKRSGSRLHRRSSVRLLKSGRFSKTLLLARGSYRLKVLARDGSGMLASVSRKLAVR